MRSRQIIPACVPHLFSGVPQLGLFNPSPGGFYNLANAAVNHLYYALVGVTEQPACMGHVLDFAGGLRANVAELELADPARKHLVSGCYSLLHRLLSCIVPAVS